VTEAKLKDLKPTPHWNDEIHPGQSSLAGIAKVYRPLLDAL
jgi:hypothetical protein